MSYDPYGFRRPQQPPPTVYGSAQPYQYPPAPQQPVPQYPVEPLPQRAARWSWAVLAAALVLLVGVGWWVYDTHIRTDTGLAACKAVRDGGKIQGAGTTAANNNTMTEATYRQARKVFQDSRYDDIRAAGTKLMDVVWQVVQLGPKPGFEALPYVGQLTSAVTDFEGACANHGVVIKLNLNGTPAPTKTS